MNLSARRHNEPASGVTYDSEYQTLRPGVMICSGTSLAEDAEFQSSAGALVPHKLTHFAPLPKSYRFKFEIMCKHLGAKMEWA